MGGHIVIAVVLQSFFEERRHCNEIAQLGNTHHVS